MADVVVVGAGVGGLGVALALAGRGHRTTLVERDAAGSPASPDAAFAEWPRRGAPQARHSHAFLARLRNLLRDRAPAVHEELLGAGASLVRFCDHPPPGLGPLEPRPGDDDLVALACRRTTFEWVLRRHVLALPGVELVQGGVAGLVAGPATPAGCVHVAGVDLADGRRLGADLVVDASGRRSPLPAWLSALGAPPVRQTTSDTGILYSSRFYRLVSAKDHGADHGLVVGDLGYLKYAVFPGDNATLSITFGIHADDAELRAVLRPGPFTLAAAALPAVRRWVEPGRGEAISGVEVMGGLVNRRRRLVVDGRPVATGVVAVGDASVCTNPIYGRGCALALAQAFLLGDTLAAHPDDPVALAVAFADATRAEIEPWFHAAVAQDGRGRRARRPRGEPDDDDTLDAGSLLQHGLLPAARTDPAVFRAFLRMFNLLDPPEAVLRDPAVVARVLVAWQERRSRPPPAPLGPNRAELLRALAGAA